MRTAKYMIVTTVAIFGALSALVAANGCLGNQDICYHYYDNEDDGGDHSAEHPDCELPDSGSGGGGGSDGGH